MSEVLRDFTRDVGRVRDLLGLIKKFRDFGSSSPPKELKEGSIVWDEAIALNRAAPDLRTDLPLVSGSMLLYLCGRFEYFVRQTVEALCDDFASHVHQYGSLPEVLRDELRKGTLRVVQDAKRYGLSRLEADALIIGLAQNLNGVQEGRIVVASKVLSVTDSNMKAEVLGEVMKRVGMKDVWTEISKQAKLKVLFQMKNDKECCAEARRQLDEVMKDRNQLAHPTADTSFPDPDKVLRIANFLETLASVLVDVCQVHFAASTAPEERGAHH